MSLLLFDSAHTYDGRPSDGTTHTLYCTAVKRGAMFSVCTRHQSQQNGFLSLLGPLSVFSFAPISAVDRFIGVCAHKEMTMPPII